MSSPERCLHDCRSERCTILSKMLLKTQSLMLHLLLLVCSLSAGDFDFLIPLANALTGETYLFVGDELQLNCTLKYMENNNENFTAHNISFGYQYNLRGEVQCIPMEYVFVVDTELAMLIIPNITLESVGVYNCIVDKVPCSNQSKVVGISDDVNIEYAPQNVTNFQCVVYNWDEYMNCTWEHPVTYINWSNINVSIVYTSSGQTTAYTCPMSSTNSCRWSQFSSTFFIEVNVTNMRKNAIATKIFSTDPSKSVKPSPVDYLSIHPEKPDCLLLSFNHSRIHQNKIYRINYTVPGEKNVTVQSVNISEENFSACGLCPNTFHVFSVEVYPTENYSGYWSDPVFANATTLMTAPELGPQITNGSFKSKKCDNGHRNVMLMWQEVPKEDQNGIIHGYLIKLGERNLTSVSGDSLSAWVTLPCYSTSELRIYAENKGGNSLNPSVLLIPPVDSTVPKQIQDTFSVEIMPDQYVHAMWEVDKARQAMRYTMFWCQGSLVPEMLCSGRINWSMVPEKQTFFDIPISSSEAGKYLYGISETDINSTEIYWTNCLFSCKNSTLPQKLVENLRVTGGMKEVQVTWNRIECNYQSLTKVTNYAVKWCEVTKCNGTDQVESKILPATESLYTVSSLKANVNYSFTVQPISYKTVGDEVKPWKEAQVKPWKETVVKESDSQKWFVPVIVCVIVAVILVVLFILYRKCVKGKRKLENFFSPVGKDYVVRFSARNTPAIPARNSDQAARILLPSITSVSSAVPNSPQNLTVGHNTPEISDGHPQTVQEQTYSNSESALPYQLQSLPESRQSLKACDRYQQDGGTDQVLSTSNSDSTQSYHLFRNVPSKSTSNSDSTQSYHLFRNVPSNQSSENSKSSEQHGFTSIESAFSSDESHQNLANTPSVNPDTQIHLSPPVARVHPFNVVIAPVIQEHSEKVIADSEETRPKQILVSGNVGLVTIATTNTPDQIFDSANNILTKSSASDTNPNQPLSGGDMEGAAELSHMAISDLEQTRPKQILASGNVGSNTIAASNMFKESSDSSANSSSEFNESDDSLLAKDNLDDSEKNSNGYLKL